MFFSLLDVFYWYVFFFFFFFVIFVFFFVFFFFFQAEDGIRDRDVTGVQTCALPISCAFAPDCAPRSPDAPRARRASSRDIPPPTGALWPGHDTRNCSSATAHRSEERRVGKECRSRWWP